MSRITVNRTELGKAVTFAKLGVSPRPALPILGGMLVTISLGTLTLAAFDYEVCASVKVSGYATEPGSVLVDARDLLDTVRSLPKGSRVTATIILTDNGVMIECDGISASISAMPREEYPSLPPLPESSGYVDAVTFITSATRVAECAGRDDTLPVLTCVKFTSCGGNVEAVSTDRYRLAVDSFGWTGPDGMDVLIPRATLIRFIKACDKRGKIEVRFSSDRVALSDGVRTLITSTMTGEFPRFRSLIRDDSNMFVTVDSGKLGKAADRALCGKNDPVTLDITPNMITVTATRDGETSGTEKVACSSDGTVRAQFNPQYLASVLSGFTGEVRIGLKVKTIPATEKVPEYVTTHVPAQLYGSGFLALIMPVRIAS